MNVNYSIRLATTHDVLAIWAILQQGIAKRKAEGSTQWQDGYPNIDVVTADVLKGEGYVVCTNLGVIVAYMAVSANIEPAYQALQQGWLTYHEPYVVIHRLAVCQTPKITGLASWMLAQAEVLAKSFRVKSIKVDTNFDNAPMLHLFKKHGYSYAGEVYFRGSARMAFEKVLK